MPNAKIKTRRSKPRPADSGQGIRPAATAQTEEQIPALAMAAVAAAAQRARLSGLTLVEACGHQLVSIAPDGTRTVLKDLEPGVRLPVGKKIRLHWL